MEKNQLKSKKSIKKGCLWILLIPVILIICVLMIRLFNGIRYRSDFQSVQDKNTIASVGYPDMANEINVDKIEENSLNGYHLKPNAITRKGVITVFGGSEGSCNYDLAMKLATDGYEVLALYFFGQENQRPTLDQVPLEFYQEVLDYIQTNSSSPQPLTYIGISKGAEMGLVLAGIYPQIDNLVLYAPSSYVFQGLNYQNPVSSWQHEGKDLPYIGFQNADGGAFGKMLIHMLFNKPIELRKLYETAVSNSLDSEPARIKVENLKQNVLLFAGQKDELWQSDTMAQQIMDIRPENTHLFLYSDAGHIFMGNGFADNMWLGGTLAANEAAAVESDKVLSEVLAGWHAVNN